jgi:hypothetical protein
MPIGPSVATPTAATPAKTIAGIAAVDTRSRFFVFMKSLPKVLGLS